MKKELTIREWLKARDRMCNDQERCHDCPASYYCKGYKDIPEEVIDIVEQWATEHPEETLEQIGDGIFFDPKHRLVPDEVVQVFTFEATKISPKEDGPEWMDYAKEYYADVIRDRLGFDDVRCIRVQQFITKAHEEEL